MPKMTVKPKLDDCLPPDDNTDLNTSTSKHGLCPKLDNVVTHFLNGQGGWTTPAGGGGGAIVYQSVSGTTDVSTTSTSFVSLDEMELTVGEEGVYLVLFNMAAYLKKTAAANILRGEVEIKKNGTAQLNRELFGTIGYSTTVNRYLYAVVAMHSIHSLSENDVIAVNWKAVDANSTFYNDPSTNRLRVLTLIKLGD